MILDRYTEPTRSKMSISEVEEECLLVGHTSNGKEVRAEVEKTALAEDVAGPSEVDNAGAATGSSGSEASATATASTSSASCLLRWSPSLIITILSILVGIFAVLVVSFAVMWGQERTEVETLHAEKAELLERISKSPVNVTPRDHDDPMASSSPRHDNPVPAPSDGLPPVVGPDRSAGGPPAAALAPATVANMNQQNLGPRAQHQQPPDNAHCLNPNFHSASGNDGSGGGGSVAPQPKTVPWPWPPSVQAGTNMQGPAWGETFGGVPFSGHIPYDVPKHMVEPFKADEGPMNKKRVATCLTGGLRSFILPNVYKSLGDKLIGSLTEARIAAGDADAKVDVFFIGSLTPAAGNHLSQVLLSQADAPSTEDDPRVQAGLDYLKSKLRPKEFAKQRFVRDSNCAELAKVLHDQGRLPRNADGSLPELPDTLCNGRSWIGQPAGNGAFFMQAMWIDACFEDVKQYAASHNLTYDLVVRARPDLGFLEPLDWQGTGTDYPLARDYLTHPARSPDPNSVRGWDYFWTMPFSLLQQYQAGVTGWYTKREPATGLSLWSDNQNGKLPHPDRNMFLYFATVSVKRQLPMVLVRSASVWHRACLTRYQHNHFFGPVSARLLQKAEQAAAAAWWGSSTTALPPWQVVGQGQSA
ncbi:unnamed protein product [Amoebophrya sp. A120]|nr:unnamed protein product [Amoebophrya sp. A120]|eukprot:GSA120T00023452001.1